jgi:hypothetical protein
MKEQDIQKQILEYLKLKGFFVWKNHNVGVYSKQAERYISYGGTKGIADIIGICPNGKLIAIEVKKHGGYATAEQKEFLSLIENFNGIAGLARSIEDVEEILKENVWKK